MTRVHWFRKDLRLNDNEALHKAAREANLEPDQTLVATYVLDKSAFLALTGVRQHSLRESIIALESSLKAVGGALNIRIATDSNAIAEQVVKVATAVKATEVHATRAFDPVGVAEQNSVGLALQAAGVFLRLSGSNYAVEPGSVRKPSDDLPYRVYTPFYRAWLKEFESLGRLKTEPFTELPRAWSNPELEKLAPSQMLPDCTNSAPLKVIAGEAFALRTLERFRLGALADYAQQRNRADLSGTSHLSHALAHGEIHPRAILATLGESEGDEVFRKEIAWREFYADVLWHNPGSLTGYYNPTFAKMRYDTGEIADRNFEAWKQGKTGYPMVDAGMRQLLAEGWMHNRVRMLVASFLVKDLHLPWQLGAAWFEANLSDFDPASNSHGWQWTAGTGTDASPYYRVFNPVTQGLKFDPNGDYVRKYVNELAHLPGGAVHEPWNSVEGYVHRYPTRIIDHAKEREESLARLAELKNH